MDVVLEKLAEHGVMGLLAALFVLLYVKESKARIADAKDYTTTLLQMQKGLGETVDKMQEIFEELKRRFR